MEPPDKHGKGAKRGNSLGELGWKEGDKSSAGRSETGVLDERGWGVKRANSLGGAPLEGARPERRASVERVQSVEIAWGELC